MSLPVIQGANPNKILEFYETVLPNLQALETMGKIREVNGHVRMTLEKLEGIRGDLVRTDNNWQDWDFPHLLETLRKWIIRNPPKHSEERQSQDKLPPYKPIKPFLPKNKSYQTRKEEPKRRLCVYCESVNHQSVNCDKVTTLQKRRREFNRKQWCFNYTGTNHKAPECRCSACYKFCNRRHRSSICHENMSQQPSEPMLVATMKGSVTYPVVIESVNGIHCRASIFRAGKFELHKWHSNVPALEQPTAPDETIEERPTTHQNENQSYAEDQLGVKQGETKLLGVPWTNERKQYKPVSLHRL